MLHPAKINKPVWRGVAWRGEDLGRSGDSDPQPAAAATQTRSLALGGQVWPDVGPLRCSGDSDLAEMEPHRSTHPSHSISTNPTPLGGETGSGPKG